MSINGRRANQTLIIRRGDTLALNGYHLGDLSAIDDLWFTVKRRPSDADTAAVLQVSIAGLLYVNGVAADPLAGSVIVVNAPAGTILVSVDADQMAALQTSGIHDFDVQALTGAVVETIVAGHAVITGDATRSVT